MKKLVLIFGLILVGTAVRAQTPPAPQLDTILPDECTYFHMCHFLDALGTYHPPFRYYFFGEDSAQRDFSWFYQTDTTINIIGIAVALRYPYAANYYLGSVVSAPITVSLYNAEVDGLVRVAEGQVDIFQTTRWMKLTTVNGWTGEMETMVIPIQEVYFDKPVTETDSFYVGFSNLRYGHSPLYIEYANLRTYWTPYACTKACSYFGPEERWRYQPFGEHPFIFPIIDSTGWHQRCVDFVCPGIDEVSVSAGSAIVRWECDTLQQSRWQVSYGPEGTPPGGGRVLECRERYTLLYGVSDTVRYVAYVRGYCTECDKWGEWSEGIGVYVGELGAESVKDARRVDVVPNPASGRFEVRSGMEIVGVEVHDARGVAVARSEAKGYRAELDASGWPAGVYIVTVRTRGGEERRSLVVE